MITEVAKLSILEKLCAQSELTTESVLFLYSYDVKTSSDTFGVLAVNT